MQITRAAVTIITNEMIEESMIYDTSFEIDEDGNINLASSVRRPFKEGINYEK